MDGWMRWWMDGMEWIVDGWMIDDGMAGLVDGLDG